jgi:hypothetical protein
VRNRAGWHDELLSELNNGWPKDLLGFRAGDLLDIELALYLREHVMPTRAAADVWTLLGGYPYSEVFGDARTDEARLRIRRARHYLWDRNRRYLWLQGLEMYLTVPQPLRGYDMDSPTDVPRRLAPARVARRFEVFERLLTSPPPFEEDALPIADAGSYVFYVRDQRHSVSIPAELIQAGRQVGHDLTALPAGKGAPIEVEWKQLEAAAAEMDRREQDLPAAAKRNHWAKRLARVSLRVRDESQGAFVPSSAVRVDRLMHMVGMVGAGKSTIRDILAYQVATDPTCMRRVTIVVGDVAEMLTIVEQFRRLGVPAAPILGASTRERNIARLHRRIASTADSMLSHEHPGFTYLSSACPLDALREFEAHRALRIHEAPCTSLLRTSEIEAAQDGPDTDDGLPVKRKKPDKPKRHGCPLWYQCPRHIGARQLVDARVLVATPASLVHSRVPVHLNRPVMRYLELVCRLSDLIIVDEADRVQMQLDTAFAPAATLVAQGSESWLDEVAKHKLDELARNGRMQLSAAEADDWINAVNTVTAATDRIYSLLINNGQLRRWISQDHFSAATLHRRLINKWFPQDHDDPGDAGGLEAQRIRAAIDRFDRILDRFRDEPLEHQVAVRGDDITPLVNSLRAMAAELLHTRRSAQVRQRTRDRLLALLRELVPIRLPTTDDDDNLLLFEFTLLLSALDSRLNLMTNMWARVEAALNLEATSNVLSRRPPRDYAPVVPESPMGNVLGYQFQAGDRHHDGAQSGELRFFRCTGVGRELLLELPNIPKVDDRPGPNVLLMSATSWAGTSSRYHLHAPVDAVLRPHDSEIEAIKQTTFRMEFLFAPGSQTALRLSGTTPAERPQQLKQMLIQLACTDGNLIGAKSLLEQELEDIDDPERRRILLLVGSYDEAETAGRFLDDLPNWKGKVAYLVSDDTDLDHTWRLPGDDAKLHLPRGEITEFATTGQQILVAPLLAVERGHNIVVSDGKAAIGSVYFLARPHHRPDDISLATQSINDWAVRYIRGAEREFQQLALAEATPDAAGLRFRREARRKWNRYLTRRMAWTSLPPDEKASFTWDQLVVIWQVIGRLVRGGVPARVNFVDGAFSPLEAGHRGADTPATSLLVSMREQLRPYFDEYSGATPIDRSLVKALYEPLYKALCEMS